MFEVEAYAYGAVTEFVLENGRVKVGGNDSPETDWSSSHTMETTMVNCDHCNHECYAEQLRLPEEQEGEQRPLPGPGQMKLEVSA